LNSSTGQFTPPQPALNPAPLEALAGPHRELIWIYGGYMSDFARVTLLNETCKRGTLGTMTAQGALTRWW